MQNQTLLLEKEALEAASNGPSLPAILSFSSDAIQASSQLLFHCTRKPIRRSHTATKSQQVMLAPATTNLHPRISLTLLQYTIYNSDKL